MFLCFESFLNCIYKLTCQSLTNEKLIFFTYITDISEHVETHLYICISKPAFTFLDTGGAARANLGNITHHCNEGEVHLKEQNTFSNLLSQCGTLHHQRTCKS